MNGSDDETRRRLSRALYGIHKRSKFYSGTTAAGKLHLMSGGSIGGEDGMPMEVGMNAYSCCAACSTRSRPATDEWPCATVRLLLEAGVVVSLDDVAACR